MKFLSKCKNQVLCIKPSRAQIVDGITVPIPGEHIRFNSGEYETNNQKEIEFIKKHRLFNSQITAVEEKNEGLDALKQLADELGIQYSPNIGFDTLKKRIEDAKAGE